MTERSRDALDDAADFAATHLKEYGANRMVTRFALLVLFFATLGWPGLVCAVVALPLAEWLLKKLVAWRFNM